MKLWMDDVRAPPDNTWQWARTLARAQEILSSGDVVECSLDHDLGLHVLEVPGPGEELDDEHWNALVELAHTLRDHNEPTGLDLVHWMIEHDLVPEIVTIHSWNPEGAQMMAARLNYFGHNCLLRPYKAASVRGALRTEGRTHGA